MSPRDTPLTIVNYDLSFPMSIYFHQLKCYRQINPLITHHLYSKPFVSSLHSTISTTVAQEYEYIIRPTAEEQFHSLLHSETILLFRIKLNSETGCTYLIPIKRASVPQINAIIHCPPCSLKIRGPPPLSPPTKTPSPRQSPITQSHSNRSVCHLSSKTIPILVPSVPPVPESSPNHHQTNTNHLHSHKTTERNAIPSNPNSMLLS